MRISSSFPVAALLALTGAGPGFASSFSPVRLPLPVALGVSQTPRQAHAANSPVLPSGCNAPLHLSLRPGLHFTNAAGTFADVHAPPDAPPGPVVLRLPIYPGATSATHQFAAPVFTYLANPYLKTNTADLLLPADEPTADAWYLRSFAACGYTVQGSGSGGTRSGEVGQGIQFRSGSDSHVTVWVVFEDNPVGGSFVLYVGEDVTLPPRPRASYLPTDVLRVLLRYLPYTVTGNFQQADRFTIRQRATIRHVVGVINSLSDVVSPGWIGCTWDGTTTHAWIQFLRRSGQVVKVRVVPGCNYLVVDHTRPLVDTGAKVWKQIEQVATECRRKRC